ncbi:hypothetical protein B0J15DRAFT_135508 [Fusarium solani]|uniref:Uncharacterized protein n=1 Tax=Fusarium solani TaxID=169388 RepID=A0A9P9RDJ9_FUSSL|nr:uncharacterized protein B0J15DRAFT_135508 [Fusarium solani]KAH7274598.1 hypothetical protein B0J15DRAFT_135508 [Fusarium solani]
MGIEIRRPQTKGTLFTARGNHSDAESALKWQDAHTPSRPVSLWFLFHPYIHKPSIFPLFSFSHLRCPNPDTGDTHTHRNAHDLLHRGQCTPFSRIFGIAISRVTHGCPLVNDGFCPERQGRPPPSPVSAPLGAATPPLLLALHWLVQGEEFLAEEEKKRGFPLQGFFLVDPSCTCCNDIWPKAETCRVTLFLARDLDLTTRGPCDDGTTLFFVSHTHTTQFLVLNCYSKSAA